MSVDGYDYKALVVRKDLIDSGAFKSLADLNGKKVAVVAQGAADESVLHQALLNGGLQDADIERVYIPFSQQLVALQNKGIDAAIAGEPDITHMLRTGVADVSRVCPSSIRTRPPMCSTAANSRRTRRRSCKAKPKTSLRRLAPSPRAIYWFGSDLPLWRQHCIGRLNAPGSFPG